MDIEAGIPAAGPGQAVPRAEPARVNSELFARNMDAFKRMAPALYDRLAQIARPQSTLIATPGGGYDIEMGGARLYGGDHHRIARRKVEQFFRTSEAEVRIQIAPPDSHNLDSHSNKPIYRLLKRATEDYKIAFATQRTTKDSLHLVVLGVGLAAHIPLLVRRTKCHHLLLVEPNVEFLYHSLHVFDWVKFLRQFLAEGGSVNFITDPSPILVSQTIQSLLRYFNAPAIDGTFVYLAHPSSFLSGVASDLSKNRDLLLTGLGFLEDERDMVRNSHQNLVDYSGQFMSRRDVRLPVTAFVVASGPSVDNDLDFIRANADRAIVISCGTALRILLSNGIRPDFHMEMENVPVVYDLISKWDQAYSLKGITLVATTTINPRVSSLFDRTIFYIRPGVASCPMFSIGNESLLPFAGPMVSNLGMAFAQHAGASTIYLFGVDCGARDPKRHHGKDTPYEVGEIGFNTKIDQPVPGNFGGTVYSEFVYLWSRDQLQAAILALAPRVIHYNCADGVRIDGATPKLSRTVTLPLLDKAAVVAKIIESYPPYPREKFDAAWTDHNHVRSVLEFRNKLLDITQDSSGVAGTPGQPTGRKSSLLFLDRIVRNLMPRNEAENSPEYHYFRGTVFLAAIAMYYYYGRITNLRKRPVFVRLIREELITLLNDIADYIIAFYRELDPEKTQRDEDAAADLLGSAPKPMAAARKKPKPATRRRPAAGRKKPAATKSRRAPSPSPKRKKTAKRPAAGKKRPRNASRRSIRQRRRTR